MEQTLNLSIEIETLTRILLLGFFSFVLSMLITPLYTNLAFRNKWWKKARTTTVTGESATVFNQLHASKHTRNIPTMAGIVFVFSASVATLAFNLSRAETWLPLAAFAGAATIGLVDDFINVRGQGKGVAGLPSRLKLLLTSLVAAIGGLFFYFKLDVNSIAVPWLGELHLGLLIIPLFILVVVSTANAVNISDGLDGLAGGLAAIAFGVYALIALIAHRYGVAGLIAAALAITSGI